MKLLMPWQWPLHLVWRRNRFYWKRLIWIHVYAPDAKDSPAGDIAHNFTEAAYDDWDALAVFASQIDAVTSEFENVPASTMTFLAKHCLASPGEAALHTAQHRIREKTLARDLGIETPAFWHITTAADLADAMAKLNERLNRSISSLKIRNLLD